jgi:hypothetical protein
MENRLMIQVALASIMDKEILNLLNRYMHHSFLGDSGFTMWYLQVKPADIPEVLKLKLALCDLLEVLLGGEEAPVAWKRLCQRIYKGWLVLTKEKPSFAPAVSKAFAALDLSESDSVVDVSIYEFQLLLQEWIQPSFAMKLESTYTDGNFPALGLIPIDESGTCLYLPAFLGVLEQAYRIVDEKELEIVNVTGLLEIYARIYGSNMLPLVNIDRLTALLVAIVNLDGIYTARIIPRAESPEQCIEITKVVE